MIRKINHILDHKGFTVFALIFMAYLLGAQADKHHRWTNPPEKAVHNIGSDGTGYYAYLPQYIIYGTHNFEFSDYIEQKYPGAKFFDGISPMEGKKKSDKYFVGTAICMSPFFWTAHQVTKISGGQADGYSVNYEISVFAAALAFWLLGTISLLVLLRSYGVNRFAVLFGIAGLTFATNLNFYIVYDPAFSHAYTFGIVCFLMLQVRRFVNTSKSKHLIWIFILLGMITIIRPTNLIVALIIPFFFSSFKVFWQELKTLFIHRKMVLFSGVLIFLLIVFLQFLNIRSQHDFWGFNAYSAEGFDYLFSPKIGEVLFGFRKGFFVYTPFMLLFFPALYFLFRWNRYFFLGTLLFFAAFTYITASWWCWYYGGSLGMRPMIDIYGVMIVPVILLFAQVKPLLKTVLIAFLAFMVHYNLVLNYQMTHAILHYAEMNREKFNKIFLQTGRRFEWIFHTEFPDFDDSKYAGFHTYKFDPVQKSWKVDAVNGEMKMDPYMYLPYLVYKPEEAVKNSDIALKVRYFMRIDNEKNIPKNLLFGYKNGERQELSVNFMGVQIAGLDQYYPIDSKLYSAKKYGEFDSLVVILENGEGEGKIKQVECTFFKQK